MLSAGFSRRKTSSASKLALFGFPRRQVATIGLVARKLRLQFEGAIYHVINRGNYRPNLFENPGDPAGIPRLPV